MSAISTVARRFTGSTLGSNLVLIILVAVTTGFVEFAVSGARRTESSFPRFVDWAQPPTVTTGGPPDEIGPIRDRLPELEALPIIENWQRIEAVLASGVELTPGHLTTPPRLNVAAVGASSFEGDLGRVKLVAGHLPADSDVHDVITDFPTADAFGLRIDDRLKVVMQDGTRWPVRLVGVVSVVESFPTIAGYLMPTILFPRGFVDQYPEWTDPWAVSEQIWLPRGAADIDELVAELDAVGLGDVDLQAEAVVEQGAKKVMRLQSLGLWLAAVLGGATGFVVIAQLLSRQRNRAAADFDVLRALGLSARQALAGTALGDAGVGLAGALLGTVLAISLSPLTPFGVARNVETDPGVWVDPSVIVLGGVLTVVMLTMIGAESTGRLLRRSFARSRGLMQSPSRVGHHLVEPVATGWRIAFGRRRAIALGLLPPILAVVALVVVAANVHSVSNLPRHPQLTGGSWDAFVGFDDPAAQPTIDIVLRNQPEVAAVARGGWSSLDVGDTDVYIQVLQPNAGVEASIVRGRAPVGTDEIALGEAVLDDLHIGIGSTVPVVGGEGSGPSGQMHVVGEVVLASPLFQSLLPDTGGLISDAASQKWISQEPLPFLVTFHDGVTPQQGLEAAMGSMPPNTASFAFARTTRGDVLALNSMVVVPWLLAGFLGLLAIGSLLQWSILASRRERHHTAVLRALGWRGRQVAAAFATAGALVSVTTVAVGIAAGTLVAGLAWRAIAEWLLVVPRSTMPWALCLSALTVIVCVAVGCAAVASRRHVGLPASDLRTE